MTAQLCYSNGIAMDFALQYCDLVIGVDACPRDHCLQGWFRHH